MTSASCAGPKSHAQFRRAGGSALLRRSARVRGGPGRGSFGRQEPANAFPDLAVEKAMSPSAPCGRMGAGPAHSTNKRKEEFQRALGKYSLIPVG